MYYSINKDLGIYMNISSHISDILEDNQIDALAFIGDCASRLNIKAFLIGGSVRDLMLGSELKDIDISIESHVQTFIDSIPTQNVEVLSISKFETAKIKIFDQIIDLAMTRSEFYYESASLPEVAFSDIYEDIYRRDFTINTLAVYLNPERWGDILDICNGLDDIKSRRIKILYPTSFSDDPTRVFRAFRYAGRLDFEIDETTRDSIQLDVIKKLSGVRIHNELKHIFSENNFVEILKELDNFGVFESIYDNLYLSEHFLKVMLDNREIISSCSDYGILAIAFDILSDENRIDFSKRLDLSNSLLKAINDIKHLEQLPFEKCSELYYSLMPLSDLTLTVAKLFKPKEITNQIDIFLDQLKHVRLKISGEDLLERGISGPDIGNILEKIQTLLLDGEIGDNKSDQILVLDKLIIENNKN